MFTDPPAFPGRATASRAQRFFYESRITAFFRPGCATGGATGNRRPDHCPRRQAAVFQFTIVHHCSLLFTIVRHCSEKKYCPALVPRRQFFLERTKTRLWFSRNTNHETRNTAFFRITALIPCPLLPTIARYCPALLGGKYCPARVSSCRPVAAFLRVVERQGRLWRGMGGLRPPHRQHGLLGFHQPRDTQHGFSLSLRRLQGEQPKARPTGFSRITRSRDTAIAWRAASQREFQGFHETRITNHGFFSNHGLYASLLTISHHFPPFPTISRHYSAPPPPNRSSVRPLSTVLGKPQDERRLPPLPPPSGLLPAAAKER